ncbi:DUF7511 domain-containing protein [Natronomonas marina]|jgi:hypothetical protein|uniref:DUF7511 domain-containing protein n=1 Tax=Natronomonas marina TaxID=2961939 RepID=UPI0020C9ECA4|nr:hypothetical protein [Natronomonas marina]
MSTTDHDADRPLRRADRPPLCASLTTVEDGLLQCTLHPPDPDEAAATTRWLTAEQGSFVDAGSMR